MAGTPAVTRDKSTDPTARPLSEAATPSSALDAHVGGQLLADLGFLHVPGRPRSNGSAYLFVALRRRPTLQHFDPERVEFWSSNASRGEREVIDWTGPTCADTDFKWGAIRVVDRKSVANEFVSFGGTLDVRRIDDLLVAVFRSDAPIAARGGHSQGFDLGAAQMAGFVGRLRAAAGASRPLEIRLAELPPLAIYAAFLADGLDRHAGRHGLVVDDEQVAEMLRSERHWLQAQAAEAWSVGAAIAAELA